MDGSGSTDNSVLIEVLRDLLRTRGEVVVPPVGLSMGERYRRTEGLVLQPPRSRVRVGDVVAFSHGVGWTLHRVLAIRGDRLLTKGDALGPLDESPILIAQVEAVLVARVVNGRRYAETRGYATWAVLRGWLRWLARWVSLRRAGRGP